jgi:dihydrofolate reductase
VSKVLVNTAMSLDGMIAGPNGEMDWIFEYPFMEGASNDPTEELVRTIGSVLLGRNCYDVGRSSERTETSGLFGGWWTGPQFVLTHRPPDDEEDPTVTFVSGDIRECLAKAELAANGKSVLVLGANVVGQCLDQGLVDEFLIFLVPVILGTGVRLFDDTTRRSIKLEPTSVNQMGAITNLRFRVVKSAPRTSCS